MRIDPLLTASPLTNAVRPVTTTLLRDSYLAPPVSSSDFGAVLTGRPAPWSDSLAVAPEATASAVQRALMEVIRATSQLDAAELLPERLPDCRARTHLTALRDLWRETDPLPEALAVIRHVLGSEAEGCLEPLPVVTGCEDPFADPVDRALASTLVRHHGSVTAPAGPATMAAGALGHVQVHLGGSAEPVEPDGSLKLYGLRDPREEADFAAALAQSMLDAGQIDSPHQIGLLPPADPAYDAALAEAFDRAGLPLSSRPAEEARDLVGELLLALLAVLEGPAPRTALAGLHASPLMPWPAAKGRHMAREIIEYGWSRSAGEVTGSGRAILDALRPVATSDQLIARLLAVAAALPDVPLAPRVAALKGAPGDVPDWEGLRRLAAPRPGTGEAPPQMLEGVSLFEAGGLPWRPVRHLIVLGLHGQTWPWPAAANPMFTEGEIALIRRDAGLSLPGRGQHLARGLELFRRLLCAATEGATLLAPARGLDGKALAPSTGLALICNLLGETRPERLVRAPEEARVPLHPIAPLPKGGAAGLPEDGVLRLQDDLLRIRETGEPVTQSPSRLETLLYSPLAWTLGELDAKDRTWAPEQPDVRILGTLIGRVLEVTFSAGAPVPDDASLALSVPVALADAIARSAPWLDGPHWAVERVGLEREALSTARTWARFLRDAGAEILGNEVELVGEQGGITIAGRADTLLRLPGGTHLLIDHKRASGKGRRDRMAKGWDLQVALYRGMLERPAGGALQAAPVIGYHNSLDGTVLIEAAPDRIPGTEVVADDISSLAMAQLAIRLTEVSGGQIKLNRAGDAKRLKKECGITAYAFEDALIAALMMPEPDEEDTADD